MYVWAKSLQGCSEGENACALQDMRGQTSPNNQKYTKSIKKLDTLYVTNKLLFSVLADVVHMTCRQVKSAKDDLALAVSTLLHTEPCEGVYRSDTQSQATLTPKQVSAL